MLPLKPSPEKTTQGVEQEEKNNPARSAEPNHARSERPLAECLS